MLFLYYFFVIVFPGAISTVGGASIVAVFTVLSNLNQGSHFHPDILLGSSVKSGEVARPQKKL